MLRRFLVTLSLATLALAGAARADGSGGSITASQGSPGAVSPDGTVRYVALAAGGGRTMFEAIRTRDGWTMGFGSVAGAYGTPWAGPKMGGLSPDGRTLVLAQATAYTGLRRVSRFLVFDTRRLWRARRIALLPQRIADRTQRGWVMSGYPVARATSAGGRWVYTLYQNPGGYPFVHALDTVGRRAHCVGVPWRGKDQSGLWKLALSVGGCGKQLALRWRSGRRYLTIDTRSFRISHPQSHRASGTGAGLWPLAGAAAAALALASGGLFAARRRWRLPKASAARNPAPIP